VPVPVESSANADDDVEQRKDEIHSVPTPDKSGRIYANDMNQPEYDQRYLEAVQSLIRCLSNPGVKPLNVQ
jgi:hypothetical protein